MGNQLSGLRNLPQHKWGFRIAIAAATIGVIYGYDLGNISGALLFITDDFGLSTKETEWVATIVVAGSIAGALVASRLANAIGRKPTMVLVALTYALFAVLSSIAPLVFLDVARFFLGVTIGISVVTAPIFVAESAPAAIRGGADRHVPGGDGHRDRDRLLRRLRAGGRRGLARDARAVGRAFAALVVLSRGSRTRRAGT